MAMVVRVMAVEDMIVETIGGDVKDGGRGGGDGETMENVVAAALVMVVVAYIIYLFNFY